MKEYVVRIYLRDTWETQLVTHDAEKADNLYEALNSKGYVVLMIENRKEEA